MDAPGRVRVGAWATPRAAPGAVVVRVGATGVCAGDLYLYKGVNPYASYPVIGGHEIAGTVHELGEGVRELEVGGRVVVEPFIGCGHCYACRAGKANCCAHLEIIGVHRPGGFAEFVAAPAANVHRVPEGLSLAWASFAEPLAVGVQACRRGEVGAEDVLVLGCGPIGLAIVEVARARGARVLASDVLPGRLEHARELGAEPLPGGDALDAELRARTNPEGVGVVIEATGVPGVMERAMHLVAPGGRVVIVGLAKQGQGVTLPGLDLTRKEMTILGSRASVNCFPEALDLLASGRIRYPEIMNTFPMWEAPEVFGTLERDPGALDKAVLLLEELGEP